MGQSIAPGGMGCAWDGLAYRKSVHIVRQVRPEPRGSRRSPVGLSTYCEAMSGDGAVKAHTRVNAEAVTPRRRRPRGSLSREEILDAAREIVEREGLRQLSMPTLATHLK